MEIRQLKYFVQVCEARSFTAAAQNVGVSQPALSQSIIELERQLDTSLLDRRTDGTYPTIEGEALMGFAKAIVRQHDRAIVELEEIRNGRSGFVTLGVHSAWPRHLCIQAVEQFRTRYPKIEVRLISTTSTRGEAERLLAANEWDAALLPYFGPRKYSTDNKRKYDFEMQLITRMISHVYARKGHPLTELGCLSSDDLSDFPWVLDSVGTAENLADQLEKSGSTKPLNCGLVADDFGTILETVVQTDMLCVAPEKLIEYDNWPLVKLKQNAIQSPTLNWGVMTSLTLAQPKPLRFLISCLAQEEIAGANSLSPY